MKYKCKLTVTRVVLIVLEVQLDISFSNMFGQDYSIYNVDVRGTPFFCTSLLPSKPKPWGTSTVPCSRTQHADTNSQHGRMSPELYWSMIYAHFHMIAVWNYKIPGWSFTVAKFHSVSLDLVRWQQNVELVSSDDTIIGEWYQKCF